MWAPSRPIWRDGWREAHLGRIPDDLLAARLRQSFESRAAGRVSDTTVAVTDHGLAGFVMVVDDEVEQVYVGAGHRGTRVAGALLAEAERRVAAAGHQRAWLAVVADNARARHFYARHGWTLRLCRRHRERDRPRSLPSVRQAGRPTPGPYLIAPAQARCSRKAARPTARSVA